jgi:hypothetical protein
MSTKPEEPETESEDTELAELLADTHLWESKQLGATPEYARRVSAETEKEIDDALGLQAISIRLQKELVEQLKELAKRDGIGYQPYIRQLLTRHVREVFGEKSKRERT